MLTRFRPVVTPNSRPIVWSFSPSAFSCSVGKGPLPTLVVYALTTPMVSLTLDRLRPRPVKTPPRQVLEAVT